MLQGRCTARAIALTLLFVTPAFAEPRLARSADAFVDSIGVNTHFGNAQYPENAYASRQIAAKLASLGVGHIRDHTWNEVGLRIVAELHQRHRIGATLVLGETTRSPAELVRLLKAHRAYEAIEGLNEPDFTKRSYTSFADDPAKKDYAATRAFQDELYAALKADARTRDIPVLSPAMGRSARSQFLLPLKFDVAALHRYAWEGKAAMEPGFGLDEAIANMARLRGEKPIWATETGYYNEPAAHARAVPEAVAGIYTPRLVAEFFNRGVARTYLYELADQGPDKTAREQNFGLLRHDLSEKPAYVALKNLIGLLREPPGGAAAEFVPATLDFTLDPPVDSRSKPVGITHLQKRDGTHYLLLWQQVSSYDAETKSVIDNAALNFTLSLPAPFDVKTYLPNDSTTPTGAHRGASSVKVAVSDRVLLVELRKSTD